MQTVHNVSVAGQRPLTLVLHSMGRFTALRDLSVALFRSYGADNFFASLPPSLTRLRATGLAGFKVPPCNTPCVTITAGHDCLMSPCAERMVL